MFLFFVFFTFAIFSAKLAKLCAGTLLFQLAEVIDKNNAVKVIDFMLNTNGEKPRAFKFEWFTFSSVREHGLARAASHAHRVL